MLSEYVTQYHSVGGAGGDVSAGVHSQVFGSPRDSDVPDDRLQICNFQLLSFETRCQEQSAIISGRHVVTRNK
jgi:hypothetical protein